jgi:hypothetical protein
VKVAGQAMDVECARYEMFVFTQRKQRQCKAQCVVNVNIASFKVVVKSAKAVQIRVQFVAKVSERGLLTRSNVHLHPRSFYAGWSVLSDCFSSRDFEICA